MFGNQVDAQEAIDGGLPRSELAEAASGPAVSPGSAADEPSTAVHSPSGPASATATGEPPVAEPPVAEPDFQPASPANPGAVQDPASPLTVSAAAPEPEQVQQVVRALAAARRELEDGRFDEANAVLQGIEQLPMLPEHEGKFHRLHLLAQYARNFRAALDEALAAFRGGEDIVVGGTVTVGVVQASPDSVTVKVQGANRTYAVADLPPELAIAIAETRLKKDDPVVAVMKAAYLATLQDHRTDRIARARQWFAEAARAGVEIGDLQRVLDDRYDAPAAP